MKNFKSILGVSFLAFILLSSCKSEKKTNETFSQSSVTENVLIPEECFLNKIPKGFEIASCAILGNDLADRHHYDFRKIDASLDHIVQVKFGDDIFEADGTTAIIAKKSDPYKFGDIEIENISTGWRIDFNFDQGIRYIREASEEVDKIFYKIPAKKELLLDIKTLHMEKRLGNYTFNGENELVLMYFGVVEDQYCDSNNAADCLIFPNLEYALRDGTPLSYFEDAEAVNVSKRPSAGSVAEEILFRNGSVIVVLQKKDTTISKTPVNENGLISKKKKVTPEIK